jgi:hypothetical protein
MSRISADEVVEKWLELNDLIDANKDRIFERLEISGNGFLTSKFNQELTDEKERTTRFIAEALPYAVSIVQWADPDKILLALKKASEEAGPGTDPAGLIAAAMLIYLLKKGYDEVSNEYKNAQAQEFLSEDKQRNLQRRLEYWKSTFERAREIIQSSPSEYSSHKSTSH